MMKPSGVNVASSAPTRNFLKVSSVPDGGRAPGVDCQGQGAGAGHGVTSGTVPGPADKLTLATSVSGPREHALCTPLPLNPPSPR